MSTSALLFLLFLFWMWSQDRKESEERQLERLDRIADSVDPQPKARAPALLAEELVEALSKEPAPEPAPEPYAWWFTWSAVAFLALMFALAAIAPPKYITVQTTEGAVEFPRNMTEGQIAKALEVNGCTRHPALKPWDYQFRYPWTCKFLAELK